ncbi:MAG: tRNA preQ1(34) S-adenosylmethionine ribosyltransferase-isomerase QueA [Deltaproteobacteria bacterium RIFOXYD12_FULL_57_12]|nr:MAG: tRNA preQ1(34) S-adenosylmethionine ribosyltransferase-isomerase QueA [Deltaproteobacteria bacterium RIFOXYD12_FULL_57_12]
MTERLTDFDLEAYDYVLPAASIAQLPAEKRDGARLLVVERETESPQDLRFPDIVRLLQPEDILVVNNTRVFPARLIGRKESGGRVELFLLQYPSHHSDNAAGQNSDGAWSEAQATALIKTSKKPKPGARFIFGERLEARLEAGLEAGLADGKVRVALRFQGALSEVLACHGKVPLPPYINRSEGEFSYDRERYQTLFADRTGAVAAPTAGLHFSKELLAEIKASKVAIAQITLHVGYGTFAPVRATDIRQHRIHEEYVSVPAATADLINRTKKAGGRIWAVGTTTVRALEFAAATDGSVRELEGWCGLYIVPGYRFKVVDNLITNFHLPKSSLLFLVASLVGRKRLLACYQEAIRRNYRFYSYGDAMAIITR